MDFKNGVENIQAAAYNGARTVIRSDQRIFFCQKAYWVKMSNIIIGIQLYEVFSNEISKAKANQC